MKKPSVLRTLPGLAALLLLSAGVVCGASEDYPLHGALYREDSLELVRLLRAGHDPNARNDSGQTPLSVAASLESLAAYGLVEALLDFGADPDTGNRSGLSPLHKAVLTGNLAVVKLLLDRGADPIAGKAGAGTTPLLMAYAQGRFGIVEALKKAGATVPEESEPFLALSGMYIREARKLMERPKPHGMSDDEWQRLIGRRAVHKVQEALKKPGATAPEGAESTLMGMDLYFRELGKLREKPKPQGMSDDEWQRVNEQKAIRRVQEITGWQK